MKSMLDRRNILQGLLGGAAVTVGLPMLNCFLDSSGKAMAETGKPIPVRFGTWMWGLGINDKIFRPKKTGLDYDLPEEIAMWEPVKKHVNVFTGYKVFTDGRPNFCHTTGWVGIRCGEAPATRENFPKPTIDVLVADAISAGTRFESLTCSAMGSKNQTYSFRNSNSRNPPEYNEVDFYAKMFGPDFKDPNSPNFTPSPSVMIRKSVLSAVMDKTKSLTSYVDGEDKARLDQYFTSVRELEQRLAVQLQKPPPAQACVMQKDKNGKPMLVSMEQAVVKDRHRLMTDILVMALACNQTRVFNMMYSDGGSAITRPGVANGHHFITHEEPIDRDLGYQPNHSWLVRRSMDEWVYFVNAMSSIKEGDATLLDNSLVFAHTDQSFAKLHEIDSIPMMTAGKAGGKIKEGIHVTGEGAPVSQVTLTVMQAAGLSISEIGTGSMKTQKTIGEVLV